VLEDVDGSCGSVLEDVDGSVIVAFSNAGSSFNSSAAFMRASALGKSSPKQRMQFSNDGKTKCFPL